MLGVMSGIWPLLLGMMLLMLGNGLQSSLLGIRGADEGFSTFAMSMVMSAYFLGVIFGSRLSPSLIRRVGHVRVFAALGSMVSAILILFPVLPDPISWALGRVVIGFCFSGLYVTAESWLNNASANETRGQTFSLYMMMMMLGVILAQALLNLADTNGYVLFIIASVLVSLSFTPILLSISPTPAFELTRRMSLVELFHTSPLGFVGTIILGGVFAAQFGMSAVFAREAGLTTSQISFFIMSFYVGALIVQYPVGWLSDRMDRRKLILICAACSAAGAFFAALNYMDFTILLACAFFIGGTSNPLYALLIAHVNDHVSEDLMASVSGGLVFVNGLGAVFGPLLLGQAMAAFGPSGFFYVIALLSLATTLYAAFRATRRDAPEASPAAPFTAFVPTATPIVIEAAGEWAQEAAEAANSEENESSEPGAAA